VNMRSPAAALAGVPVGMQSQGVWIGRRQIFVRFAGEGETATLYTADGLRGELKRLISKSGCHSICICGRDVLGNADYVAAVLTDWEPSLPVLLDTDGQRPDAVAGVGRRIKVIQVSCDYLGPDSLRDRAVQTVAAAMQHGFEHALVLSPREDTSDGQVLRVVEKAHAVSETVAVVVHPFVPITSGNSLDRRWSALLEQLQLLHGDVRIMLRVPPPAGMK
jgi:hypothetical protein